MKYLKYFHVMSGYLTRHFLGVRITARFLEIQCILLTHLSFSILHLLLTDR